MSCPSCFCPACQAERERWLQPPRPVYVPITPAQPNTVPLFVCALCGMHYTGSHVCMNAQ